MLYLGLIALHLYIACPIKMTNSI